MNVPRQRVDLSLLGLWRISASRRDLCLNPCLQFALLSTYLKSLSHEIPPTSRSCRNISVGFRFRWGRYPYRLRVRDPVPLAGRTWNCQSSGVHRLKIEQINEFTHRRRTGYIEPFATLTSTRARLDNAIETVCWLSEIQSDFYQTISKETTDRLEDAWKEGIPCEETESNVVELRDNCIRRTKLDAVEQTLHNRRYILKTMRFVDLQEQRDGSLCRLYFRATPTESDEVQFDFRLWTSDSALRMPFSAEILKSLDEIEVQYEESDDAVKNAVKETWEYRPRKIPPGMLTDMLRETMVPLEGIGKSKRRRRDVRSESDECVCMICLGSPQDDDDEREVNGPKWIKLPNCRHCYHEHCIFEWLTKGGIKDGTIKCVYCYQPQVGGFGGAPMSTMCASRVPPGEIPLGGYGNVATIVVEYAVLPRPSRHRDGLLRSAFLPFDRDGLGALILMNKAFRMGYSFVVSERNSRQVQWGLLPHKSTKRGPEGFPDAEYFTNVKLAAASVNLALTDADDTRIDQMLSEERLLFNTADEIDEFITRVEAALGPDHHQGSDREDDGSGDDLL